MCLAIPGRLVAIQGDGDLRVGEVDFGGVSRDANLAFVPEAVVGDYVLVHVGFAIARIEEQVAQETLEALTMLEALTDPENQGPMQVLERDASPSDDTRLPAADTRDPDGAGERNLYLTPISWGEGR